MHILLALWVSLAPLIVPRQELAVAAVGGHVYAIGGLTSSVALDSVERYDLRTNSWSFVASMPETVHHPAAVALGDSIYVIGGYRSIAFTPVADVYRYDVALDSWSRVAELPSARGALAAVAIDGKIYAVGGAPTFNDLLVYDPAIDQWMQLAPMPTGREHLAAVAVDGKLYVAGGRTSRNSSAFEMYDPATNRWTSLSPLPTARGGLAAAVLDNHIYVFGGEGNPASSTGVFAENESYDLATGTWASEPRMKTPRHGIGAATVASLMIVPGGAVLQGFGTVNTNEAFGTTPLKRRAVRN